LQEIGNALINPLNAELDPTCHLLALLGSHHILHVSKIRVNVIRRHACGGDEGKNDKPQSGELIARRMVEAGTSPTQFCNITTKKT